MKVKKGQVFETEINDVVFGGKGLARIDGLAVFVAQAVPGDRVLARITKKKKSFAEARVLESITASPDRIHPPCPYSGFCGGCTWQFIKYDKQLQYKRQHVQESIEHIGLVKDIPVEPTIPSPLQFGYRNKMEFSCSDRRWLLPDELGDADVDIGFALGLHVPGTFYKVLDTEACLLQPDRGNRILGDVRQFIKNSGIPVYGLRSHVGFWRFLVLRHSAAFDQWMVNIVTSEEKKDIVQPFADGLMEKHPSVVSVVNNITGRKAGVAVGEHEIHLAGERTINDKIGPYGFEISSNSFFQTNTRGALKLYETVKQYAGLKGSETVLDLYSGTGTIPIFLADSAKSVIGLEIVESAVADAVKNCEKNGISNCRFVGGDIKDSLSGISEKPDLMIIDPPRVGMHKDVVRQVMDMAPDRIVYVSCNPATLARDLGMMKDLYRVLAVQPVDMFPHTFHIESVAKLERI
jgi:23S rRNA (uracil1939-C5)-methyltransferase